MLILPEPILTVHEQLVCFRGRCPFQHYILSKPKNNGMKIWAICKANTSYALKIQVYTGKNVTVERKVNQGAKVVKYLAKII